MSMYVCITIQKLYFLEKCLTNLLTTNYISFFFTGWQLKLIKRFSLVVFCHETLVDDPRKITTSKLSCVQHHRKLSLV